MYFDHLTRVIKMAFVCIFQLFVVPFWRVRAYAHSFASLYHAHLYLQLSTEIVYALNVLLHIKMLTANREKKYTQQQQQLQQQQHLALEFIWLIPFQSTFCSFSLIVFPCRVRFFSLFFNFFLYFVCLVRINDMPFSYCSCCCCWSLIVVGVVAAVNFKYFLFPCIRRSTICSSSECDGSLLFSSFISFFCRVCVCIRSMVWFEVCENHWIK